MTPFTRVEGVAAPLMEENIDTDVIFPARFLLITAREGLGRYAFHDRRYDSQGAERPGFILNRTPFSSARILIADTNFGSGSSREQAVWALAGAGIACIIAPSFGEIFKANCYRNGVLPIALAPAAVAHLAVLAGAKVYFVIDLATQNITAGTEQIEFEIPTEQRLALLNGWDDTATILNTRVADICAFEEKQKASQPWLWEEA